MLIPGLHCSKQLSNVNDRLLKLKGNLSDEQAQITFAKFLKANPHFACQLLFGVDIYPFQDLAIRAMFQKDFVLNVWSRGLSKCENKDSLIFTDKGLVKMEDVQPGDYVQSKLGKNLVLDKTINSEQKTFKLTTSLGFESEGLDYHRVLTLNSNLEHEWRFVKDLKIGDILILRQNSDLEINQRDIFEGWVSSQKETVQSNLLKLDKNFSDWYYFFGLLLGDGCIGSSFCAISSEDSEVLDFLRNFSKNNNLSTQIHKKQNSKCWSFRINSVSLMDFLRHCGFDESKKAKDKIIPTFISKASAENLGRLLKGLFDTDGFCSVQKKKYSSSVSVGFCSSSYNLIKQVRAILLTLGIVSKTGVAFDGGLSQFGDKYYECNKAWSLTITSSKNVSKFNETVGFLIKRKQNKLDQVANYKYTQEEFSNYIPLVGEYLKNKYNKNSFRSRKAGYKLNFRKNTSFHLAQQLIDCGRLKDEDAKKINNLINPNLFYDEVKSIENSSCKTVDIQVQNEECYVTDGVISHNSFVAGLYIGLYAIFNPGVKIGICSKTFRQSKIIFKNIMDLCGSKKGFFFKQCVLNATKGADAWEMEIGDKIKSRIVALPLGDGGKIRGYRFDVMVIDELLLLSDNTINEVIRPFLVVNTDPQNSHKLKKAMKILLETGELTPEDAADLKFGGKKLIGLTSASYKFEYLYSMYSDYIKKITNPVDPKNPEEISHLIMQYSHKIAPEGLMNTQQINEARSSMSAAQFAREMESQFTDDSAGFFSAQRMKEVTIPDGQFPCTRIYGNPNKKYILSIDPNYNDSESSDHFAMAITELDETEKSGTLVHSYALAKCNISARVKYLKYIFDYFNIVFVIVDSAGGKKFINDANELPEFKEAGINLKFIEEVNFMDDDYVAAIDSFKQQYSKEKNVICYAQRFESKWIRAANEHLQASIEKKRIFFASKPQENEFLAQLKSRIPIKDLEFIDEASSVQEGKMAEFIDHQSFLIDLTKTECAMIEVSSTSSGSQTFDLPPNLRKSNSPDKPRKDSYTALLLNNWAIKCYFDMMFAPEKKRSSFVPFILA